MLEIYLSLVRNAASVVKSTLPSTHILRSPLCNLASTESLLPFQISMFPLIDLIIAPLQLVAGVSGGIGGVFDLILALQQWRRTKTWSTGTQHMESRTYGRELRDMRARAEKEVEKARDRVTDACFRIIFGLFFYVFFLSTLQKADERMIQWTLFLMEVAALACLVRGAQSVLARRERALHLLSLNPADLLSALSQLETGSTAFLAHELMDLAENRLVFTWDNPQPYHPYALLSDLEHLHSAYTRFHDVLSRFKTGKDSDAEADVREMLHRMQRQARALLSLCAMDALVLLFNAVAFLGYLFFPLVWLFPDEAWCHRAFSGRLLIYPGHAFILDRGAFIGDVMWTLEPACLLAASLIRRTVENRLMPPEPEFNTRTSDVNRYARPKVGEGEKWHEERTQGAEGVRMRSSSRARKRKGEEKDLKSELGSNKKGDLSKRRVLQERRKGERGSLESRDGETHGKVNGGGRIREPRVSAVKGPLSSVSTRTRARLSMHGQKGPEL